MILPIRPVVLPADLRDQQNGKLAACLLTPVFFQGVGHASLHKNAARAWNAMVAVAHSETKATMTITSAGDAYRSYDQQYAVFMRRYRTPYNPVTCTTLAPRDFQGKRWWKLRNVAAVATPGRSNHGWALAADAALWSASAGRRVSVTSDPVFWDWLVRNAISFGFSWEGEPDTTKRGCEPWHLRFFSGDVVPSRVLEVESFLGMR